MLSTRVHEGATRLFHFKFSTYLFFNICLDLFSIYPARGIARKRHHPLRINNLSKFYNFDGKWKRKIVPSRDFIGGLDRSFLFTGKMMDFAMSCENFQIPETSIKSSSFFVSHFFCAVVSTKIVRIFSCRSDRLYVSFRVNTAVFLRRKNGITENLTRDRLR